MSDKPILFSGPMIRALLEGRKTQTRRVLKNAPCSTDGHWFCDRVGPTRWQWTGHGGLPRISVTPPYAVGDRLWVREGFFGGHPGCANITYRADQIHAMVAIPWKPSIFMPRWASRLTLIVTDVRVQRLQDISANDCFSEGIQRPACLTDPSVRMLGSDMTLRQNTVREFASLWDSLNAKRHGCSWGDNPWVVALTFDVIKQNIDQIEKEAAA